MTMMMTSTQGVKTSVIVITNSPFKDYTHPDDHTSLMTPGFKPFTVNKVSVIAKFLQGEI